MTKGIYLYIDTKKDEVVYVGKDSHIDKNARDKDHRRVCNYNAQKINQVIQNNPDRYKYVKFVEGDYDDEELNNLEIKYIKEFNTYHYDNENGFNFTLGGDGATGHKWSNEARCARRKQHKFWDCTKVLYHSSMAGNGRRCFYLIHDGFDLDISIGFQDWFTVEGINDLIDECIGE